MIYLVVILIFGSAVAQDADCDIKQNVRANESYYINEKYSAGRMCKYIGICPEGYNCRLDCNLSMPSSGNCSADHLLLSRSGDPLLAVAEAYCGNRPLTAVSSDRTIGIGLIAPESSRGGSIRCRISAQRMPMTSARGTNCSRCGERRQPRVVGGEEVRMNEYTMMVAIMDNLEQSIHCGGVIVSSRHVLTAAHCVAFYRTNPAALSVVVGQHYIEKNIPAKRRYKISRFIIHENYNMENYDYDIALVVVKRKIVFSEAVLPACLPFKYRDTCLAGQTVTILGWGLTVPGGPKPEALRKVDVTVVGQEACRASETLTDRHICTFTRGRDACQFDSGGPLLLTDPTSGLLYVVGLVSNGYSCATARPAVNTRVTALLPWLDKYTDTQFCNTDYDFYY